MIEKLDGDTETVEFRFTSSVRFYRNNEPEDYPLHWHTPGEIICPISNTYRVTVAGQTVTLQPHDILVIASGELHSIKAPPAGERYILNFGAGLPDRFPELSCLLASLHPFLLLRHQDSPDVNDRLFAVLARLEGEYFSGSPYRDSETAALMLHFFSTVGRLQRSQAMPYPLPYEKHRELFASLCDYINAHCTEDLSAEGLATKAGFSQSHFSRLFKDMTGTTCRNYLAMRRIIYAKSLLADSSLPVTEIAIRSGFNSLATFNRVFRAQIGCTPTEFRRLGSELCFPGAPGKAQPQSPHI